MGQCQAAQCLEDTVQSAAVCGDLSCRHDLFLTLFVTFDVLLMFVI